MTSYSLLYQGGYDSSRVSIFFQWKPMGMREFYSRMQKKAKGPPQLQTDPCWFQMILAIPHDSWLSRDDRHPMISRRFSFGRNFGRNLHRNGDPKLFRNTFLCFQ